MKYTFGTDIQAADRLRDISSFFNPLAMTLIKNYIKTRPSSAVDLGCGPGYTTVMLDQATNAKATYGLDNSSDFLWLARSEFKKYAFIEHDITKIPFPIKADTMYCRFLLSHLENPTQLINKWLSQLNERGLLFIEELEDIQTDCLLFSHYLETNAYLISSQGAQLYVGKLLSQGEYNAELLLNDCSIFPVADKQAAMWFLPNTLTVWRTERIITDRLTVSEIEETSNSLQKIIGADDRSSNITWNMRRIVLRK